MAKEIERKFLVKDNTWEQYVAQTLEIKQGYLAKDKDSKNVVRVRWVRDSRYNSTRGYITIKGPRKGISRTEYEMDITDKEALNLLKMCKRPIITKIRHIVSVGLNNRFFKYEIDKFTGGPNKGLILAEVELTSEKERFPKPEWLGKEVSQDDRYSNSYLTSHKVPRR